MTEFGSDAEPTSTRSGSPPGSPRDGPTGRVHVERLPRCHQVGRRLVDAAGLDHRRSVADTSRMPARRKPRPDRARALSRAEVEQLLTREDLSLRERTL